MAVLHPQTREPDRQEDKGTVTGKRLVQGAGEDRRPRHPDWCGWESGQALPGLANGVGEIGPGHGVRVAAIHQAQLARPGVQEHRAAAGGGWVRPARPPGGLRGRDCTREAAQEQSDQQGQRPRQSQGQAGAGGDAPRGHHHCAEPGTAARQTRLHSAARGGERAGPRERRGLNRALPGGRGPEWGVRGGAHLKEPRTRSLPKSLPSTLLLTIFQNFKHRAK